ncbi:structural maintenance of chromosome protein [Cavenderia fasciculata]|uniref:Structural maintenance of chromosomes protein n=1 Tax=Cavenderia fasciculata TaxID=261658 RepID=F4PZZ3_CACFS|nr:structural maintenance of chromosome protein [Cavenderia fasciculata]EGG18907.1 structural maintenance of chromosome protein [Cavenderia fasciculata]|eukprot:XP_004357369.1 structural maintenance of chromosome protein [Cavenderia fasciculata]
MNKVILTITLLLAFAALFATAAPQICSSQYECDSDQYCVNGYCAGCKSDCDCKGGQFCSFNTLDFGRYGTCQKFDVDGDDCIDLSLGSIQDERVDNSTKCAVTYYDVRNSVGNRMVVEKLGSCMSGKCRICDYANDGSICTTGKSGPRTCVFPGKTYTHHSAPWAPGAYFSNTVSVWLAIFFCFIVIITAFHVIESITLEGFKSYARKIKLDNFDPSFNAITGMNGSGKSNILDAICFVLGISKLGQVRATKLDDLVYKQGQAGITRATVSITFNNLDKSRSPLGYETHDSISITRQVAIGGRTKYMIGGQAATQDRIKNLFDSVQLNVNNPHFLIMQGRITKVINMKPHEFLSLVEEAAGTRMFEQKKKSALDTIAKKELKLIEINRILNEEVTPKLLQLRTEKQALTQFLNNEKQLEQLERYCTAYEYFESNKKVQGQSETIKEMNLEKKTLQDQMVEYTSEIDATKKKMKQMQDNRQKQFNNQIEELEAKEDKLGQLVAKQETLHKHKKEALDREISSVGSIAKSTNEIKQSIANKIKEKTAMEKKIEGIVQENDRLGALVKQLQNKLEGIAAGITTDDDQDNGSFTDQLMNAKKEAVRAASEFKQAEIRIKHMTEELSTKKKSVNKEEEDFKRMRNEVGSVEKEVVRLREQVQSLEGGHLRQEELLVRKGELEPTCFQIRERIGVLASQLSGMEFTYSDPSRDFDRSKVRGVVANLISLKDADTATALEICAGGKLYNVIVEDEITGKALLAKGNLRRRMTFLPLNQIDGYTIDDRKVKGAEKLAGKDNVKTAISLVNYDPSLQKAMNFVFGSSFIAKDKKFAQMVAFDKDIKTKTISLEGDEYNPVGSLTGGSRQQSGSVLNQIQKLNEMNAQLRQHQTELEKINYQLAQAKSSSDQYKQLKQNLQLKEHELGLINQRLEFNPQAQLLSSIKEIEIKLESDKQLLEDSKKREKEANAKAKELESQSNDFQARRDKQLKEIEKNLAENKEKFNKSNKIVKSEQQGIEKLTFEIEELESELATITKESASSEDVTKKLQKELEQLSKDLEKATDDYNGVRDELEKLRQDFKNLNESIREMSGQVEKLEKKIFDTGLNVKKAEHKISTFTKEIAEAEACIRNLDKQHPWIKSQKHFFGMQHGDFDFENNPQQKISAMLKLRAQQNETGGNLNKNVLKLHDQVERDYVDLKNKKETVEKDKEKIEAVIKELDEKKNESLEKTWKKVNNDFGKIFSGLLKGATAKLEPLEGKSVLEGLDVKVALGGVWKDTLSELSGGQKSLLALSLILALLLFNPAPVYILDEVDSALDLSHTQNIGEMLKEYFNNAQFIVVSLKEGMFNNANILFETRFVDGISEVRRNNLNQNKKKKLQ